MSTPTPRLLAAIGVLVALSIGCGDGPTDPAPAVPGSIAAASATALSGTVGQPVTPLPSVVVRNQHGEPMFGVRVTFAATGGGTIAGATAFTDANGIATVGTWTLGPTAGEQTLTATAGSLDAVAFVATAQAGAAESLAKSAGDEQTGPVATALPVAPAVVVSDLLGNPVAGATVVFEASGGGSITAATAVTNNLGVAAVGSWTLGTTPGPNTLTATMGEITVTFTATAVAGDPAAIVKHEGDNQTATVAQPVTIPPAVRITDAHGNPAAGIAVTFAVAPGGGSLTGGSQITDGDGVATVGSWTLGTAAGSNTLTATAGSLSTTFTATGTAAAPANIQKTAGDGQTADAGEELPVDPAVRLTDSFGNPVAGVSVTFTPASGGGTVTGPTPVTGINGVATVGSWTLGTGVGENTLTASAGVLSVTFTATGVAGPPDEIIKVAGDNQDALVGTDVPTPPSVQVVDEFGNAVAGVTVTFTVTSGDGLVDGDSTAEIQTGIDGIAAVGSWTLGPAPGDNTLTATAGSLSALFTATAIEP
ncbi:MAG TPA: hypothetical protein VMM17_05210 [Gemmatimonadaceae bacterium]|nr:hypothetical protein [Gemmatimonadaceae bacterium]